MRRALALLLFAAATAPATDPKPVKWDPESADLLFAAVRDKNSDVFVRKAGQKEWVNLTKHEASDNWPEWSPDGERIAFQSRRTGNLDIWVMKTDGSDPTRLTTDAEPDYLPAWSPDGKRIAFTSWRKEPGDAERAAHVYVMNADGTGQRRLVAESLGTSAGAAWSPDGKQIVFSRKAGKDGADVIVADANGTNERKVVADGAYNGSPVFSPDGKHLAFYADDGKAAAIVVANADGTGRRVVHAGGHNWYPRWSPDGKWLVYTAPVEGGEKGDLDIFAVPVEGGKPVRVVGGPGREAEGRWRP